MVNCTIYKDVYSSKETDANYITITQALKRIESGRSKEKVLSIRSEKDKEKRNKIKSTLPSIIFQGEFSTRSAKGLINASGFAIMDFDDVEETDKLINDLKNDEFIYSTWVSPSGNGVKALIRIPICKDDKDYKDYYGALLDKFKDADADKSTKDISRVCFESYDSSIYINESSKVWDKKKIIEVKQVNIKANDNALIFKKLTTWLSNQGDAFRSGERNNFIFKLAAACCRYGINESECISFCSLSFNDSTFTDSELTRTVKSAYSSNASAFNTAEFEENNLVDKTTRKQIKKEIDPDIYNHDLKPKDVIFGKDVEDKALEIFRKGYEQVEGVGLYGLDSHFKLKRKEMTLLTGIGNYGKSSFLKWFLLMRIIKFGDKFALFAPEDNPAEEFYHDMVEIYLGADCTPKNPLRPSEMAYKKAYEYISKHLFYIYPETVAPTPDYIKERFLELIIKEKVNGCIIDPFNQMTNDYNSKGGRSDKYLETILSDFHRFAQANNQYFIIVAHPRQMTMRKDELSYPCPNVFDIADGAMWNNKMDNILVYHRPEHQENPTGTVCELHTKKIRRQKTVGKKGTVVFNLDRKTRRFLFESKDPLEVVTKEPEQISMNDIRGRNVVDEDFVFRSSPGENMPF